MKGRNTGIEWESRRVRGPRRLTPRQRIAIRSPVTAGHRGLDPRFHRVSAPFQSVLTFDLHQPDVAQELPVGVELVDGYLGMWHARIARLPQVPLDQWSEAEASRAQRMASRLVASVGHQEPSVGPGPDNLSYRAFRWATLAEVRMALEGLARPGKPE